MIRRFTLSSCLSLLCALAATAQTPASADSLNIVNDIERSGRITITQPEGLARRVQHNTPTQDTEKSTSTGGNSNKTQTTKTGHTMNGYRVEVFSDNNVRTAKKNATARKAKVQSRFLKYRAYLIFESPYWRVRVGDFASREAAQAALAEIRSAMPSIAGDLRVVRCTVNR